MEKPVLLTHTSLHAASPPQLMRGDDDAAELQPIGLLLMNVAEVVRSWVLGVLSSIWHASLS